MIHQTDRWSIKRSTAEVANPRPPEVDSAHCVHPLPEQAGVRAHDRGTPWTTSARDRNSRRSTLPHNASQISHFQMTPGEGAPEVSQDEQQHRLVLPQRPKTMTTIKYELFRSFEEMIALEVCHPKESMQIRGAHSETLSAMAHTLGHFLQFHTSTSDCYAIWWWAE